MPTLFDLDESDYMQPEPKIFAPESNLWILKF